MFSWDSRLYYLAKYDPTLFESLVWPPYVELGVKKKKDNLKSKFANWFVNEVYYIIHI